jgi:hypothetical protein
MRSIHRHLGLYLVLMAASFVKGADAPQPQPWDRTLLGHWTFNETAGTVFHDRSGKMMDAQLSQPAAGVQSVPGIFDGALSFRGQHLLQCGSQPVFEMRSNLSFSVWVQPAGFERYNEIFRKEDGDQRVLFSFQENGQVLSLGLNIGGYVECDARLDPDQVLDGCWHHCGATFDGQAMRVYFDGAEIGALKRPGTITAGGPARACIGSLQGHECFQGLMDELCIYAHALSADEIKRLHRDGLDAISRAGGPGLVALDSLYTREVSFAKTMAAIRRRLAEIKLPLDARLAAAFQQRLAADFSEECREFRRWAGAAPVAYLRSKGNDFQFPVVARQLELMLEYRPLTDTQRQRQTAVDRQKWAEGEALQKKFESLKARGEAAQFSPEWIELILAAGPRIQFRPVEHEAVAPYVVPQTPATRSLSAAEGRKALERDWLHQADQNPAPARIRQEIQWTRELAVRLHRPAGALAGLAVLEQQAALLARPDAQLYFRVREFKRRLMFQNPVLDFDQLVFVDMPYPAGSEWQHETRHRLGYMAVPGARLLVLKGLAPDGVLTQLMPQAPLHGSFWRPEVSWDGKKVLFCFKPHNEKSFHLFEINADGTGLRQITDGPYDDLDPAYLPDGKILFSTTRGNTYVRCMPPTSAFVLARCDPDGHNMYFVSANNEPDYLPSVLPDGRVIYTRWEYTDKPLWRAQKLWTINPDGTQVSMFWGNQSVWPDVTKDVRAIPGSRRVMFTGSAHHDWFAGSVGIIDPDEGLNFPLGLKKVTADVVWPECGNGPVDPVESPRYHASGQYPAYYSPYPLSEQDFLVSARRGGKFCLYLMDVEGNRELIYEGVHHIFHALPLKPRPVPPLIADRVSWPQPGEQNRSEPAVLFSHNVYENAPPELRGRAKFLRVLSIDYKTYTYWYKRPHLSTGPVVSGVQSEGVKRIIGTVPIGADGSVSFHAPAGLPLHFQLLDENQRALQTMRSFVSAMPGEYRGCTGCHESHSRAPEAQARSGALERKPQEITPPPWTDVTVSYPRYVRPVLDQYCARCHTGDGEGRKKLDLAYRPGFLEFDEVYWLLIGRPTWGTAYTLPKNSVPGLGIADMIMVEGYEKTDPVAYRTMPPMTRLSYRSRLIEIAASGKHHDVKVDALNLQRLICWVDAMCPYQGDEEIRQEPDPVFQGVEWLAVRPKITTAPHIARPGPVE